MENQELTKNLMCIVMRNKVEFWIEEERIKNLINNLETFSEHKFIKINNEIINTADVTGIFSAKRMEDLKLENEIKDKIKKGEWQCEYNYWHSRNEECGHKELAKYGEVN